MEGLCRIEVEEKCYIILTKPENGYKDGYEITLSDGEQVWRKAVTKEEVSTMSKTVDMSDIEYAKQTSSALTGLINDDTKYIYQVTAQDQTIQFAWKKSLQDGLKFQLGSLTLDKMVDCSKIIMDTFGVAVRQINQFKGEIEHLQSENGRLSDERKHAVELLDTCVTAKDNMESELYFKFASVLNKKKEKVRQLKSQVEDFDQDTTDGRAVYKAQSNTRSPTSEDRSRTPSPARSDTASNEGKPEEKPSTPTFPSLEDDEEIITHPKRRKRRGPQKETPKSKLVLPKVSSVKKTMSTSSEDSLNQVPRLRKRRSEKSEPDPDDLMAEMAL